MKAPTPFNDVELRFLTSDDRPLGRVATVGADGTPHVVPSGWTFNEQLGTVDVTGRDVERPRSSGMWPALGGRPSWSTASPPAPGGARGRSR